ncbi:MAG: efflux RND transporter permease subunit [Patescibacteria group bacterium]|nr:efflux RND transporter permease subunit [Patescibacteria group bacterium]
MKKFRSYIDQLKFDKNLWNSLPAKWIFNIRLVVLLVTSVFILGIFSMFSLPRRLNPQVQIPIVVVSTILPGAGPSDIEQLVTKPLEEQLVGMDQLDTITSTSKDDVSIITLQFFSSANRDKVRNDVQSQVNNVAIPEDAQTPQVIAIDFENQPVWTFALSTTKDIGSLMRFSKRLKDDIKNLPSVKEVDLGGYDQQEVSIFIDPEKASQYGLNPLQLSQIIKTLSASYPAGTIDTANSSFSLTIDSSVNTIDDLRNIVINPLGPQQTLVHLGDIAQISEKPPTKIDKSYIATKNTPARQAVTFSVYKTSSGNIDQTASEVEKLVNDTITKQKGLFQVTSEVNLGNQIKKQYTDLLGDFITTLALVFVDLFIFLGLKEAALATFATPLTFLSGLIFMYIFGLSINFISLFAFLLALGTSIDDTIVTVSAMTSYYRSGKFSPAETGLLVWRDFIVPIWSTTITTVWAYVPLLITSGIIGEFIKPIPIVVTATMYSSTFFAVMVTLPLLIVILKPKLPKRVFTFARITSFILLDILLFFILPKTILLPLLIILSDILLYMLIKDHKQIFSFSKLKLEKNSWVNPFREKVKNMLSHGLVSTRKIRFLYQRSIMHVLESKNGRRDTLIVVSCFAIFSYLLVPLGLVKNEFFPKTDADTLYVTLEMPPGTNTSTLENHAQHLINELRNVPYVNSVVEDTGKGAPGFGSVGGSNEALLTLDLSPKENRSVTSITIAQNLRDKYKNYASGIITVQEESGGPPVGADIQIKLLGDDLSTLNSYADKIVDYLKSQKGVTDVSKSVKPGISKMVFLPDKEKLASSGISQDQLGLLLRSYASGFTLDKIRFNESQDIKTEVNFRFSNTVSSPEKLDSLSVLTPLGPVPLLSLGKFTLRNNPTVINHEAGKRTLSVSATVKSGFVVSDINTRLERYASEKLKLPEGYTWKTGGVNEENNKSVMSIFQAMLLSFILILVTMVVQFRSFRQAVIVLLLIPLAISGVFIIFGLTATPLSFPALIGVLALFGIVVTNAMFIVDKINRNRSMGMKLKEALADAAESRLEPIMLTSLTTILGLIPISISNPLWRGLGGAIIAGLTFSGLIMLFFVPVMYYLLYKKESK